MATLPLFLLLGLLCLILIGSTNLIVKAIKSLAGISRLGVYGITAFLLAISTSLPELVVSVVSSIEGNTSLILGNIIGSNIADLSLVIGGAAVLGGSLKVAGSIQSRDVILTGAAGLLPIFLIADGALSRADGVVLLTIYCMLATTFLRSHHRLVVQHAFSKSSVHRLLLSITRTRSQSSLFKFGLGVILLLVSSHFIVQIATQLALSTGLSSLFIGLFVVAVGTSLPEFAFEIRAVQSGQSDMALGDLLGSVVANSTLILGLSSLIRPMTLTSRGLLPYGFAIGIFVSIYLIFVLFVRTKKRLERWEGVILITLFLLFLIIEYAGQSLH